MSSIGIAELTSLGAAPASGDLLVVIDISDTGQSLAGSTKNMTVANLFSAVPVAAVFTSTVGVTGNFAVNTNKFTVAASSGNTAVAGTLNVTGATTVSAVIVSTSTDVMHMTFAGNNDISLTGAGGLLRILDSTSAFINLSLSQAGALAVRGTVTLADILELSAAATARSGSVIGLGGTTQTTIGANGAATALTANPLGYLIAYKGTTKIIIPYYNG